MVFTAVLHLPPTADLSEPHPQMQPAQSYSFKHKAKFFPSQFSRSGGRCLCTALENKRDRKGTCVTRSVPTVALEFGAGASF